MSCPSPFLTQETREPSVQACITCLALHYPCASLNPCDPHLVWLASTPKHFPPNGSLHSSQPFPLRRCERPALATPQGHCPHCDLKELQAFC
jgi:hypothetical protein